MELIGLALIIFAVASLFAALGLVSLMKQDDFDGDI